MCHRSPAVGMWDAAGAPVQQPQQRRSPWPSLPWSSPESCKDPLCHRGHLAQDGLHVVVSSQKQQNSAATLQGEGLSVTGTMCHVGKAEDWERLVDMVNCREMGKEPGGRKRSQPKPPSLLSWTALVNPMQCC
uniref:Uncharacterized protein n=1 Tax=Papio anubis TaxID=9555 RepID=A0A8I5NQA4_PAPAN